MPSVTHDGRSFLIDGRRVWLVSGRIPYARISRDAWADRIHAAKLAGFNTIETPVFWNRHEARPGRFDFAGDNDLRYFVDLVGRAGLYCILSMGPFVDTDWDMGGFPPWLRETAKAGLRTTGGPFLEACSRFFTAVSDQVRGWQVTAAGTGGPIILLQCETEWTCGHDALANGYLGELTRYLREAGLTVPIINSNNLWQSVEGQIDGWVGNHDLLATMRQLASVRPNQPRMVIDLPLAHQNVWGREAPPQMSPWLVQRRLAEVLAGGGQFNISSFCGGSNFGFFGGRITDGPASFATTGADHGCIIDSAGAHGPAYNAVRRLAHAASRFGRVFANLDPSYQPIAVRPFDPEHEARHDDAPTLDAHAVQPAGKKKGAGPHRSHSVVHAVGSQGGVVFVFGDEPGGRNADSTVNLMLPDGSSLPVRLGGQSVAWCLFGVNISGRSRLDYSNLSALGAVGQALVCFGAAGAQAMLSVNGSPMEAMVPEDGTAAIIEHEGLTVVLVSEELADHTFITDESIFVGVAGLTPDGAPIPRHGAHDYARIGVDGKARQVAVNPGPRHRSAPHRITMSAWTVADTTDYVDGTSARYAVIDGPADLSTLGCAYGYGWYRLSLKGESARRAHLMFPYAGDRLHLFLEGKEAGMVGAGPGVSAEAVISLRKAHQNLVVLAENLGRFSGGANLGEGKGIFGPIYEAVPFKLAKPKVVQSQPINLLEFRVPLWDVSEGDTTAPERITWVFQHRRKTHLIIAIDAPPASGLLLLNDKPINYLDHSGPTRIIIDPESLARGNNTLQIALAPAADLDRELTRLAGVVEVFEATENFTEKAEMSFAKWESPSAAAYAPAKAGAKHAGPTWWRCTFSLDKSGDPLFIEPAGMTKGQIYINGRHLGRYFVATADGKPVPPQDRYHIPDSWLKPGQPNDLVLFEEHGAPPTKVRLVHSSPSRA